MIDKIWMRLLGLKFLSDNILKSKAIKYLLKNIACLWVKLSDFTSDKTNGKVLCQL